ncbi:hypothetical protein NQ315_017573 [Exocentrus adspersus]|uniref:DDE Tnp4 domain-containing protein n=1 Tax=Exocentrus adspersus TaxID=1586481 RepID=A0AAV8VIG7_9CUCU|nr:hypothetical protein NQ315_017573 [Exocentrus adspersus]
MDIVTRWPGDSVYSLKDYLMTPLINPITRAEEMCNRCHISTRSVVERTFDIWKRRFPILSLGIRTKIPFAQKIITATAVLQNIAVQHRDEYVPQLEYEDEVAVEVNENLNQPQNINIVQQQYINYFRTLL